MFVILALIFGEMGIFYFLIYQKMTKQTEAQIRMEFRKKVWLLTSPNAENHIYMLKCDSFGIGRVMAALDNKKADISIDIRMGGLTIWARKVKYQTFCCSWKFINKDGSTCTDADQTVETIQKLLTLLT